MCSSKKCELCERAHLPLIPPLSLWTLDQHSGSAVQCTVLISSALFWSPNGANSDHQLVQILISPTGAISVAKCNFERCNNVSRALCWLSNITLCSGEKVPALCRQREILKNPPSCKAVKFDLEKSSCKTVKLDLEKVSCRAEERRSRAFTGQVSFRGWAQCTSRSSRCPGWFEETVGFDNFTFHDSRVEAHCPNVQITTLMLRWWALSGACDHLMIWVTKSDVQSESVSVCDIPELFLAPSHNWLEISAGSNKSVTKPDERKPDLAKDYDWTKLC